MQGKRWTAATYQREGVKIMGKAVMRGVAKIVERIARAGAGRACLGMWCQPKVPKALRSGK
jgi:cyclic lactone autoinducer peptide